MLDWKKLTVEEQAAAIKELHPKIVVSASRLASNFQNCSRNAIISFYRRHADLVKGFPLNKPGENSQPINPRRQKAAADVDRRSSGATRLRSTKVNPKPAPRPVQPVSIEMPEPKLKPLWQLSARECKWPVEGTGMDARFCCAPAVELKSYCPYHQHIGTQHRAA